RVRDGRHPPGEPADEVAAARGARAAGRHRGLCALAARGPGQGRRRDSRLRGGVSGEDTRAAGVGLERRRLAREEEGRCGGACLAGRAAPPAPRCSAWRSWAACWPGATARPTPPATSSVAAPRATWGLLTGTTT